MNDKKKIIAILKNKIDELEECVEYRESHKNTNKKALSILGGQIGILREVLQELDFYEWESDK